MATTVTTSTVATKPVVPIVPPPVVIRPPVITSESSVTTNQKTDAYIPPTTTTQTPSITSPKIAMPPPTTSTSATTSETVQSGSTSGQGSGGGSYPSSIDIAVAEVDNTEQQMTELVDLSFALAKAKVAKMMNENPTMSIAQPNENAYKLSVKNILQAEFSNENILYSTTFTNFYTKKKNELVTSLNSVGVGVNLPKDKTAEKTTLLGMTVPNTVSGWKEHISKNKLIYGVVVAGLFGLLYYKFYYKENKNAKTIKS